MFFIILWICYRSIQMKLLFCFSFLAVILKFWRHPRTNFLNYFSLHVSKEWWNIIKFITSFVLHCLFCLLTSLFWWVSRYIGHTENNSSGYATSILMPVFLFPDLSDFSFLKDYFIRDAMLIILLLSPFCWHCY